MPPFFVRRLVQFPDIPGYCFVLFYFCAMSIYCCLPCFVYLEMESENATPTWSSTGLSISELAEVE